MSSRHILSLLALTSLLASTAAPALADPWHHEREVQRWERNHPNAIPVQGVVPVQTVLPMQSVVPVYPSQAQYVASTQAYNRYRRAEKRLANIQFAEWVQTHPQWMQMHSARAQLFLANPTMAERYRGEWFGRR